jgi:hypothetical protein
MIKLFEENSYIKEFESQIISLDKEKNLIELENTAFYGKFARNPVFAGVVGLQDRVPPDMHHKKATRTQQFPRLSDNNWSPLREIILQTRPRCAPPGK